MFVDCCRWWTRIHLLDARSFCVHKQRERFCSLLTIRSFQLSILISKVISSCVWSWNSAQVVTFIRYDNGSLANISLSRQQGEIGNKIFFFFLQKVLVIFGCLLSPGTNLKTHKCFIIFFLSWQVLCSWDPPCPWVPTYDGCGLPGLKAWECACAGGWPHHALRLWSLTQMCSEPNTSEVICSRFTWWWA